MCFISITHWRCPRCGKKSKDRTTRLVKCATGPHETQDDGEPLWVNETGKDDLRQCENCGREDMGQPKLPVWLSEEDLCPESLRWLGDPMRYPSPPRAAFPADTPTTTTGSRLNASSNYEDKVKHLILETRKLMVREDSTYVHHFSSLIDVEPWMSQRNRELETASEALTNFQLINHPSEAISHLIEEYDAFLLDHRFSTASGSRVVLICHAQGSVTLFKNLDPQQVYEKIQAAQASDVHWIQWGTKRFTPVEVCAPFIKKDTQADA